ncbi:MAG: MBL fold metallo-hydrolase [Thermoanaerobaculia bacterium]
MFAAALLSLVLQTPGPQPPGPYAVVLGIAQDGGVPHAGCRQPLCVEARKDPAQRRRVASLGLVDPAAGRRFLVDATPDFADQIESLGGRPDGILLTHAHIGHYLGLAQLGREVLGARKVLVYCTPAMAKFLRENKPWSRLVALENIAIREVAPGSEVVLTDSLRATPIRVPHRDEDSDTVAWLIRGPARSILWLPDIDKWEKWDRSLPALLEDPALVAFVDGTFHSADEIPGRSIAEIPHPLVAETTALLAGVPRARDRVYLVHLNHTNRLLWDENAKAALAERGIGVAREGQRISLAGSAAPAKPASRE